MRSALAPWARPAPRGRQGQATRANAVIVRLESVLADPSKQTLPLDKNLRRGDMRALVDEFRRLEGIARSMAA